MDTTTVYPLDNYGFQNTQENTEFEAKAKTAWDNNEEKQPESSKSTLTLFTEESGLSGVKIVGDRNSTLYRRLVWLAIVLGALIGLLYQVGKMSSAFSQRPVNVNIRFEEPPETKFPAVTICNNNMFMLAKLVVISGGMTDFSAAFPYILALFPMDGVNIYEEEYIIPVDAGYGTGGLTLYEFMISNSHSASEMIERCSFGGVECGPDNFTQTVTNYGVCYTFNANIQDALTTRNEGERYGLSLYLNADEKEYFAPRTTVGFRLMIHGQDEVPDVSNQGLSVSPGTTTSIAITKTVTKNLGSPHSDCVKDIHNELEFFNGSYSLSKCWMECETRYVVEQCGCRYFYMPDNFSLLRDPCIECREPCEQTKYNTKVTHGLYPSSMFTDLLTGAAKYPCDVAIYMYMLKRRANEDEELMTTFYTSIFELYDTLENSDGRNISEYLDSDDFHWLMKYTLAGGPLLDIVTWLRYMVDTHTLDKVYLGESDELYSEHYNDSIAYIKFFFLDSGTYRNSLAAPIWDMLSDAGLSSEVILSMTDDLYFGYYEPLYHEMIPIIYQNIKEIRDDLMTTLFDHEDISEICRNFMQRNFAKVTIYFEDLKEEQIIQQPGYEFFNLVCDVGGTLGLFFGASLVTFLEILDFFIVRFWAWKSAKKNQQQT
uniref:Acid-sensing ion channel 1-like n=1 Tax=Saccoglossus kowalevskii TaxID=10224 RepID=A0ABM0MF52_SACKO|nr:PREDICTED: acid-sensing ion channel 1-like [Saccoglossus kowalevskii]